MKLERVRYAIAKTSVLPFVGLFGLAALSQAAEPPNPESTEVVWSSSEIHSVGWITVTHGRILAGGAAPISGDGMILSVDAESGRALWQIEYPSLPERSEGIPGNGMRGRPVVDGNRVFVQNNRGEVVCIEAPVETPELVREVWRYDMRSELGVFTRAAGDGGNPIPSPILYNDLVLCVTGHGAKNYNVASDPSAPSFIALHKSTGKLVWSRNDPGRNILYGQWAGPTMVRSSEHPLVLFPGGDGVIYGIHPLTGELKWTLDIKQDEESREASRRPLGFWTSPTVAEGRIFTGLSSDREQRIEHPIHAFAIVDGTKTPELLWEFQDSSFGGTFGQVAIKDGIAYVVSWKGILFALDARTGRLLWKDKFWRERFAGGASPWMSPVIYEDRVYAAGEDTLYVWKHGTRSERIAQYKIPGIYVTSPVEALGRLYIGSSEGLWCVARK